jgi:hypothetical protein
MSTLKNNRKALSASTVSDKVSETVEKVTLFQKSSALLAERGFKTYADKATLDAEMGALLTSIKSQDKRTGEYLLSEMMHMEQHRNTTRFNTFITGVKKSGMRLAAIQRYMTMFANIEFVDKQTDRAETIKNAAGETICIQYYRMKKARPVAEFEAALEKSLEKSWLEWSPEQEPKAYDLNAQVKKLIEGALRRKTHPIKDAHGNVVVQDNIPDALIASLLLAASTNKIEIEDPNAPKPGEHPAPAHPVAETPKPANGNGHGNAAETQAKRGRGRPARSEAATAA